MKGPLIYSVAVTIVAVGAIGVLGGFLVYGALDDQPEGAKEADAPSQTQYDASLTPSEAAAKAKRWVVDRALIAGFTDEELTSLGNSTATGVSSTPGTVHGWSSVTLTKLHIPSAFTMNRNGSRSSNSPK